MIPLHQSCWVLNPQECLQGYEPTWDIHKKAYICSNYPGIAPIIHRVLIFRCITLLNPHTKVSMGKNECNEGNERNIQITFASQQTSTNSLYFTSPDHSCCYPMLVSADHCTSYKSGDETRRGVKSFQGQQSGNSLEKVSWGEELRMGELHVMLGVQFHAVKVINARLRFRHGKFPQTQKSSPQNKYFHTLPFSYSCIMHPAKEDHIPLFMSSS